MSLLLPTSHFLIPTRLLERKKEAQYGEDEDGPVEVAPVVKAKAERIRRATRAEPRQEGATRDEEGSPILPLLEGLAHLQWRVSIPGPLGEW